MTKAEGLIGSSLEDDKNEPKNCGRMIARLYQTSVKCCHVYMKCDILLSQCERSHLTILV